MLRRLVRGSSAPRVAVIATFHVPPIDNRTSPRYCPAPLCWSDDSVRIAGMFIDGMAGIDSTTLTAASVTGAPSGCLTLTISVLSPAEGGLGVVVKSSVHSPDVDPPP
jgi:hypothetical protein